MDILFETFKRIGTNPQDYLPSKSIWLFRHFLAGYSVRSSMEGSDSALGPLFRPFEDWLRQRFSLRGGSQSVYMIISSYSTDPANAFDNFFKLFDEFRGGLDPKMVTCEDNHSRPAKIGLIEILRSIRVRPELYVGYPHFAGVFAYLCGHERAGRDLGVRISEDEFFYDEFKCWVSDVRLPGGHSRPWFKLIEYYSFQDCGTGTTSAYRVFYDLLDEFAELRGWKGLFQAA
jgi:hypothetical protein